MYQIKVTRKLAGNRTLTDTVMVEEEVVIEIESLHSRFFRPSYGS